eukprot:43836_1
MEPNQNNDQRMKLGDCVILMDRSRRYQHVTIGSKMIQRINRVQNIDLSILTDKPYGSVFELKGNELIQTSPSNWRSLREETNLDHKHDEIRDNSSLFHSTSNQQLTQDEILQMKSDKTNFNEDAFLHKIAESSKTFHLKTEFSKEKYLKSKKAKHSAKLITLKANSSNITEMYFHRKPDKTMGLRIDTMSQILSLANIHHNQYVLCVESCTGLVVGSIAERMNGRGRIFNVYCARNPVLEIANKMFDLSDQEREIICNVNIGLFNDPLWLNDCGENDVKLKEMVDSNSKVAKFKDSRPSLYDVKQWIKFEKCDSLILCCKYHPLTLFRHLYKYLDFGCPFVVWSEYIQPLAEIKQWFFNGGDEDSKEEDVEAVGLKVYENWFREQQVLPQRTHPMVSMQHLGGYILSGIKVRTKPSKMDITLNETNDSTPSLEQPRLKKEKLISHQ